MGKRARVAVVMAGGSGERFWPMSRPDRPKQLLKLTHESLNMLEEAAERIAPVVGEDRVFISTSIPIAEAITSTGGFKAEQVMAEPARRNTLGALCWVAGKLIAMGYADASVAVVTADHLIGDPEKFRQTVETALDISEREQGLATIGVRPSRPETGYGYIEYVEAERFPAETGMSGFAAKAFREKPSLDTAIRFCEAGTFLWNAGMFFYPLPVFMSELKEANPEAAQIVSEISEALAANDSKGAVAAFERLPSISVDYALMEKARRVFVIPAEFPWDDMGAWDALERAFVKDENGNVVQGRATILHSSGCVVVNDQETAVGVLGLEDIVIVNTAGGVLVCPKSRAQEVRAIAQQIAAANQ